MIIGDRISYLFREEFRRAPFSTPECSECSVIDNVSENFSDNVRENFSDNVAKTLAITLLGKILKSTQLLIYLKVSDSKYVQILRQWLNIYKY